MQQSFNIYKNYSSTQFAMDDYFIEWVFLPSEENNAFWQEFQDEFPGQQENINKSRNILLSIYAPHEPISEDIKIKVWENIIAQSSKGKIIKMPNRKFYISAAASVFLLLIGFAYFLFLNNNVLPSSEITDNKVLQTDVLPGGNRATLTLADGTVIVLDSAQNGTLISQGNAQVIKLDDGMLAYHKENSEEVAVHMNTITTLRGGQYRLKLADGSEVWLNSASSITFPSVFKGGERTVSIKGEAYFEVVNTNNRPFRVEINDIEVEVLGTHFNVNAYDNESSIKTTLLEGSIKINKGDQNFLLKPGEQVQTDKAGNLELKRNPDLESVIAWKNGKFDFRNADLPLIMRQLERWYNVHVKYEGKISDDEFVGVVSRNVHISEIIEMLEKTSNSKFELNGDQIIVK